MQKLLKYFNLSEKKKLESNQWVDLLKRNDYPEVTICSAISKLENLSDDLKKDLLHWDKTGELPNIEVEDFTVQELIEYYGLHEIAAILMLDWLRREPNEAKIALAQPISIVHIEDNEIELLKQCEKLDKKSEFES